MRIVKQYDKIILMSKKELIYYWKTSAKRNWRSTNNMFKSKDYDACLFFCHLTIEKLLKGLVVIETGEQAPRIHDLERLALIAKLDLTEEQSENLKTITEFNMACRYEEDRFLFYKKCTKNFSEKWFNICKKIVIWLRKEYLKK